MADNLSDIRDQLRSDFSDIYSEEQRAKLKRVFSESDRASYKECTSGDSMFDGHDTLGDCLETKAEDAGVASSFRNTFSGSDFQDLTSNLRSKAKAAWSGGEAADRVREIFASTNISDLNRMCAQGDTSGVEDEIGDLDDLIGVSSIDNYRDCVKAVAEAEDVKSTLKSEYGTA